MRNIFLSASVILGMACCSRQESTRPEKNRITTDSYLFARYSSNDSIFLQKTGQLTIDQSSQDIFYQYDIDSVYSTKGYYTSLRQFLSNDSIIVVDDDTCKLTGSIAMKSNSDQIVIKRYFLNDPYAYDDETNIFVIDHYGILKVKSVAWGQSMTFNRGSGFEEEALKMLATNVDFLIGIERH